MVESPHALARGRKLSRVPAASEFTSRDTAEGTSEEDASADSSDTKSSLARCSSRPVRRETRTSFGHSKKRWPLSESVEQTASRESADLSVRLRFAGTRRSHYSRRQTLNYYDRQGLLERKCCPSEASPCNVSVKGKLN